MNSRRKETTPVEAFEEGVELGLGKRDRPIPELRPDEAGCVNALIDQNKTRAIPEQNLDTGAAFRSEDKERAIERFRAAEPSRVSKAVVVPSQN